MVCLPWLKFAFDRYEKRLFEKDDTQSQTQTRTISFFFFVSPV